MDYDIHGGDNGNYRISQADKSAPVAFVRRNQSGGGYTVELADKTASVQMRHMPTADRSEAQAAMIMALLK